MSSSKRNFGKNQRRCQNAGANGEQHYLDLGADREHGENGVRGEMGRMGIIGAHNNDEDTLSSKEKFVLHQADPVSEFRSAMASLSHDPPQPSQKEPNF